MEIRLIYLCMEYFNAVCSKRLSEQARILKSIQILVDNKSYEIDELDYLIYTPLYSLYSLYLQYALQNNNVNLRNIHHRIADCYSKGYSAEWRANMLDVIVSCECCALTTAPY